MHPEAYEWVTRHATDDPVSVLDIGGRDVNGSPRPLFPNATVYTVLDIAPGDNVHIVADASSWTPDREYDVVVCTEVFEHTPVWPQICATAHKATAAGGMFIATMAGPGRDPHSAVDGRQLRDGEYYGNVDPDDLRRALADAGWRPVLVDQHGADVRAFARK